MKKYSVGDILFIINGTALSKKGVFITKGSLQIKNNTYQAVFYHDGKTVWRSTGIKAVRGNKRKAEQKMREIVDKYTSDIFNETDFIDFLKQWLISIKPIIKPSTWEGYDKVTTGKIIPYFEPKKYRLCDLKGRYFTEYFAFLKEHGRTDGKGGLSKKAILNIRGVLSSAFKYAVENELIPYNYIDRSSVPIFADIVSKNEAVIYSTDEVQKLLNYARETKSDAYLFLCLVISTGARKGELLGLTWEKVDFNNSTITIAQNRTGSKKEVLNNLTTPKSKNSVRTLHISPTVLEVLRQEKANQEERKRFLGEQYFVDKYNYVIQKPLGGAYNPNSINRIIRKMTDKLDLPPCRVHDFRHMVASKLFEMGVPLADVTLQLGHGQTSTTERLYIKKSNTAKAEPINNLTKIFGL